MLLQCCRLVVTHHLPPVSFQAKASKCKLPFPLLSQIILFHTSLSSSSAPSSSQQFKNPIRRRSRAYSVGFPSLGCCCFCSLHSLRWTTGLLPVFSFFLFFNLNYGFDLYIHFESYGPITYFFFLANFTAEKKKSLGPVVSMSEFMLF